VATVLFNMALTYQGLGRHHHADSEYYAEAEQFFKRSLAIREKVLGPEHFDVGLVFACLGVLYKLQHRYTEAEPLLKRAVAIFEKALGPEHSEVGQSLNDLANLYRLQGRDAEAKNMKLEEKRRLRGSLSMRLGSP
jgi:tetratricopeptide (TPR) repeat protein